MVQPGCTHLKQPNETLNCTVLHTQALAGRSHVPHKSIARMFNMPGLSGLSTIVPSLSILLKAEWEGLRYTHIAGFDEPNHNPASITLLGRQFIDN